ncbi:MAG: DMT family transporter [Oscillospiraceae bacterium]|jgi:RarD protein|nr:DMT family transporter [Oscillospiraceae bacterium]
MKFYLMFVAAMLIFGSNGVFASMLEMSGAQLVLLRTLIGGAVLLIIILISRSRTPKEVLLREKWRLLFAGVCLGANWALLFEAYNLMNVSLATLTYYTAPVLVLVLAPLVLKERQNGLAYLGMAVVIVGMLLVVGTDFGEGGVSATGLIVGLGSAVFYAMLMLVNKQITGVSGLNLTFIEIVIAAVILLPYVFATSGGVPLPTDARGIFALLFLCTVNTGFACWLYFSSMNRLPAKAVALMGYFDPVSALIFSAVFLDERLSGVQLAGAVLVLAGALVGQFRPRRFTKTDSQGIM